MLSVFVPAIVIAYLIGSIPFGPIIARLHGKDLRTIGSGNTGATNLARACGRKWGYVCFGLDVLKGALPVVATRLIAARVLEAEGTAPNPAFLALWLAVGIAAILGHIFPLYLKFKGGKGVATSFGVGVGLWPYFTVSALIALLIWVTLVLLWRYISLASIGGSVAFPMTLTIAIAVTPAWSFAHLWPLLIAATAIPILVIVLHRSNIKRLIAGTESKIRRRKDRS